MKQDQEGATTIGTNPINYFSQSMANKSTSQSFIGQWLLQAIGIVNYNYTIQVNPFSIQ